jgi:hypothetical protein
MNREWPPLASVLAEMFVMGTGGAHNPTYTVLQGIGEYGFVPPSNRRRHRPYWTARRVEPAPIPPPFRVPPAAACCATSLMPREGLR